MTTDMTNPPPELNNAPATPPLASPQSAAIPAVENDAISPKLVELARKQKQQRAYQLKLQAERQAVERQQAEIAAKQKEYETNYVPRDRIKTDLLGVLSEAGLDAQQIAQLIQNPANSLDLQIKTQAKEINDLKSAIAQFQKSQEEAQTSGYDQAVARVRQNTLKLVGADERFETIKAMGEEESVVSLIETVFKEGMGEKYPKGTELTVEDAAQLVEEDLIEQALKMASLNKVKAKQQNQPQTEAAVPAPQGAVVGSNAKITYKDLKRTNPPFKTITNNSVATPQGQASRAEKVARAIAKLQGRET